MSRLCGSLALRFRNQIGLSLDVFRLMGEFIVTKLTKGKGVVVGQWCNALLLIHAYFYY